MNTIRVLNSLDPDQAQIFVGPDLDQNCLQRLSADGTSTNNNVGKNDRFQEEMNMHQYQ